MNALAELRREPFECGEAVVTIAHVAGRRDLRDVLRRGARSHAATLSGRWRIVAVSGAEAFDASKTHAEFAGERFASSIGCNCISGSAALSERRLTFEPMAATRMAWPPPLDAIERQYPSALQAVRAYRLEGSKLLFLNAAGDALVTLEREE